MLTKALCKLTQEDKNQISELVTRKELINDKVFYEKVLSKLGKELHISSTGSYKDVYINALELIMKKQKVNEYEIYDYMEMVQNLVPVKGNKYIKASEILLQSLK